MQGRVKEELGEMWGHLEIVLFCFWVSFFYVIEYFLQKEIAIISIFLV